MFMAACKCGLAALAHEELVWRSHSGTRRLRLFVHTQPKVRV
jgi:hypothetical protein